jgi:hypothetical protein
MTVTCVIIYKSRLVFMENFEGERTVTSVVIYKSRLVFMGMFFYCRSWVSSPFLFCGCVCSSDLESFWVSRSSLFRSLVSFKLPPLGASRACISVLLRSEHPSAIFFFSRYVFSPAPLCFCREKSCFYPAC